MIRVRLKEIAEKRGLTQAQIVELTGASPNTVRSYYKNQVQRADFELLELFCEKLGITLPELLERPEDKESLPELRSIPVAS